VGLARLLGLVCLQISCMGVAVCMLLNGAAAGQLCPPRPHHGACFCWIMLAPSRDLAQARSGVYWVCFGVCCMQELLLHRIVLVCTPDRCSHMCACYQDFDADPAGLLREQSLSCCSPTDLTSLGHLVRKLFLTRCSRGGSGKVACRAVLRQE
jgi:hypothetical protein